MTNNTPSPLLTVCLITYNHVAFIKEAIEGVIMQKVNFSWHLVIADDFSTDGTREILLDYKEKYPTFITLIFQSKNVGAAKNWMELMAFPNSKYIAYFEGDDYWTDSLKLQKQLDFLEKNNEYSICAHGVRVVNEQGQYLSTIDSQRVVLIRENIIVNNPISTLSIVFRLSDLPNKIPNWIKDVINGDWAFFMLLLANNKKALVIPDIMGVHIKHIGGVWSLKSTYYKATRQIRSMVIVLNNLDLSSKEVHLLENTIKKIKFSPAFYKEISIKLVLLGKVPVKIYIKDRLNKTKFYIRNHTVLGTLLYPKLKRLLKSNR